MKKFLSFLRGADAEKSSHFSDFFLRATLERKREVFTEAARRANRDQQAVLERADLKLKAR